MTPRDLLIEKGNALAVCHRALADTYRADRDLREQVYAAGTFTSVAEAERHMSRAAHEKGYTNEISRIRGEIDALTVEWTTARVLVETDLS